MIRARLWPFLVCASALAQEAPGPAPATWRAVLDRGRETLATRLFGLQLSAFGDALAAPDETGRTRTDWNSFELDATGELHPRFDLAAALVTSRDGGRMTVGFLDFHPFGGTIAPRGRLWVEKGFHVQAGRFDIPFGNDWQFFASKDSVSISRPLTTDRILEGGLNDAGLRVLGNDGTLNVNAYVLRGTGAGRLTGGRLGFTPFGNPFSLKEGRDPKVLELGASWVQNRTPQDRLERAWAADAELRAGAWTARAEYLDRRREPEEGGDPVRQRGWHLTQEGAWTHGPVALAAFLRYERCSEAGAGTDTRAAGGGALTLGGLLQLKVECQRYLEVSALTHSDPGYRRTAWLAQVVLVL